MAIFGVTLASFEPSLQLHFHKPCVGLCGCFGDDPKNHESGTRYWIDKKLVAHRYDDHKEHCDDTAHARLKLIVVKRFLKISKDPFLDAQRAFAVANLDWVEPFPLYRMDLDRLDEAVGAIRDEILTNPI